MINNKLAIYDNNCPLCTDLRQKAVSWRIIPAAKTLGYDDLPASEAHKVDPERFRNEMALIDLGDGPTLYGLDGVLYIFSEKYRLVRWLSGFGWFHMICKPLYGLVAYNRYIISTPVPRTVRCACEPESPAAYRYAWLIVSLVVSILITAAFGAALSHYFSSIDAPTGTFQMLFIAGTGWVFTIAWARLRLANWLEYATHLGSVMVRGVLILMPFILWEYLTGIQHIAIPAVSVLMSSAYMLRQHLIRSRYLFLAPAWNWRWFLGLQTTAAFWVVYFGYLI